MSLSCKVAVSKYPASQYNTVCVSFSHTSYLIPILIKGLGFKYKHK